MCKYSSVILIVICLTLFSCKQTKLLSTSESSAIDICDTNFMDSADIYYCSMKATDGNEFIARQKAILLAREKLASQISVDVQSLTANYIESYPSGISDDSKEQFKMDVSSKVKQTLVGCKVTCEKTKKISDDKYEVLVMISMPKQNIYNMVADCATNNNIVALSDVDLNIPQTSNINNNAYVVIIANELYNSESKVDFAVNDGLVFYDYCVKTLGIPENHIKFAKNATYNQMRSSIGWLATGVNNKEGDGSAIFYYAGHGIPDKETETAYLLPVDGEASYAQSGIALKDLYSQLGAINSKNNLVLLDACFSGTQREGGMLPSLAKARGVAIKVKSNAPQGNTIVLSAASGEQTALPYAKMGHGMFTYYLLKKLQSSKGDVTIGELSDYITKNVKVSAFDECDGKSQIPTVSVSPEMESSWRSLTLR